MPDEGRNGNTQGQRLITSEDRANAVNMVRSGRSVATVSSELDVPEKLLRRWLRRARVNASSGSPTRAQPARRSEGAGSRARTMSSPSRRTDTPLATFTPNHEDELAGEFADYLSPGRSARNHWRLIAGIVVVFVLGAAAGGLARKPTYTAEARLVVGKTVQLSNLASIPGLAAAGQQLASDYSRLVTTPAVVDDAVTRLGRTSDLGGSLSASPIPDSPVVRIDASAATSEQAVNIAEAGAGALVKAVNTLNEEQTNAGESLLRQYRQADEVLLRDQQTVDALQRQLDQAGTSATPALKEQLLAAKTVVDADQVRVNALANAYAGAFSPSQLDQQVVQRVGPAEPTGNDRIRILEIFLAVAAISGLVLGVAVAAFIDFRRREARAR